MEEFVKELMEKLRNIGAEVNKIEYLAYADDLVFVCEHNDLTKLKQTLNFFGPKYNLKLNPKKSNWVRAKKHKAHELTMQDTFQIKKA